MKIGIIGDGYAPLILMEQLAHLDYEFHLRVDRKYRPRADKDPALRTARIDEGIRYLVEEVGVDKIIFPPLEELARGDHEKIVPLFRTYLLERVAVFSLVGKLGIIGAHVDSQDGQVLISEILKTYQPSDRQQQIKHFQQPFACWQKTVSMRTYFLTTYGRRDWMVRKTIKHDLTYFKNAAVDTLIPLDRSYVAYEQIITHLLNWKKVRFHGKKAVQEIANNLFASADADEYHVTIHTTDAGIENVLSRYQKKLLERGVVDSIVWNYLT